MCATLGNCSQKTKIKSRGSLVSPQSGLRPVFNRTGPRINRTRPVLYLAFSQFNFGFGLGLQAVQDGPNHGLLPNLVNQLVLCLS